MRTAFLQITAIAIGGACHLVAQETSKTLPADVLKKYNTEGDPKRMTKGEAFEWLSQEGQAAKLFGKMDADHDGNVTKAEMLAHVKLEAEELVDSRGHIADEGQPAYMEERNLDVYLKETDKAYEKAAQNDWMKATFGDNLKIRKSLSVESDLAEPAKFSWTYDGNSESSFYVFDGAVGYHLETGSSTFFLEPNVEAHIASKAGAERDSIAFRLPAEFYFRRFPLPVESNVFILEPYYEMDRHNDVGTLNARLLYSPTIPQIGIGNSSLTLFGKPLYWRPYVGFEYGHVERDGGVASLAAEQDFGRLLANARAAVYLNPMWTVSANYSLVQELTGLEDSHSYWEVSSTWYLDPLQRASVGVTYKNGESTPKFEDVDLLTLWFGLKF